MKSQIEFFNKNDGEVFVVADDRGEVLRQGELVDEMYERIEDNFPEAMKALQDLYEKSKPNKAYYRYLIVRRFIKCNFGEYDIRELDIDGEQWNFEKVGCPLRGECKLEGIVCNPKLQTGLSRRELEVLSLCAKGMRSQAIADKLHVTIYTINVHIKHILQKLNKENIKSVIRWYHDNERNLITT